MKSGFTTGLMAGAVIGAAIGAITDPMSDRKRRTFRKKSTMIFRTMGNAIDNMLDMR